MGRGECIMKTAKQLVYDFVQQNAYRNEKGIDTLAIAKASIPVALIAFVLCLLQNYILDRRLKQKYNKKQ